MQMVGLGGTCGWQEFEVMECVSPTFLFAHSAPATPTFFLILECAKFMSALKHWSDYSVFPGYFSQGLLLYGQACVIQSSAQISLPHRGLS